MKLDTGHKIFSISNNINLRNILIDAGFIVSMSLIAASLCLSLIELIYFSDSHVLDYFEISGILSGFIYTLIARLILKRNSFNRVGWILGLIGCIWSLRLFVIFVDNSSVFEAMQPYGLTFNVIGWIAHWIWFPLLTTQWLILPLYFPNGELLSSKWYPIAITVIACIIINTIIISLHPGPIEQIGSPVNIISIEYLHASFELIFTISLPALMVSGLIGVSSLFLRLRRANELEIIQLKWIVYIIAIGILTTAIISLLYILLVDYRSTLNSISTFQTAIFSIMIPLVIGIAILQHNLFDIDIIINRTLVYGVLTALIIALYMAIVSFLGILVQAQTSVLSGLIAAGLVAVIFQPLRDRLQKIVNRFLYGQRDEPEIIFSQFAQHIENPDDPVTIIPNLVRTIAQTLKIPYVGILITNDTDGLDTIAEWGKPPEQREMITLTYNNQSIGQLVVAPRSKHEHFTKSERSLLNTIAALTATTVQSVQLSKELRLSRQRIITAREEERRRIRRDLHDGLGPQLASQTLSLQAISQLIRTNPDKAESIIELLQIQAEEAINDVRHLVYNLRPPALDDLGLVGALQQTISRYENSHLHFDLDSSDIPEALPAAIETAIFRIVQEAITNVVRHSGATHCRIGLDTDEYDLHLKIEDNGHGIADDFHSGVGIQAMRERATELNGETTVNVLQHGGTIVQTRIPLGVYDD